MVNKAAAREGGRVRALVGLVALYVLIVLSSLVALGILSAVDPRVATDAAWVHAVIVAVFAVILPLRLRAVVRGRRGALIPVGIIAAVVFLVNVIEAMIPSLFPAWMRAQMVLIAVVMACVVALVAWERAAGGPVRTRA